MSQRQTSHDLEEHKNNVQEAAEDLMDNAKKAVREMPEAMADVKASMGLVADQVKEVARERLNLAKDYAHDVADKGREALSSIEGKVAQKPLGYAVAAGAIGLLVGLGFRAAARRS